MENSFTKKMASKSDAELQAIITNKSKYQEDAYIAAIEELEHRKLAPEELSLEKQELIEEQIIEKQEEEITKGEVKLERKKAFVETLELLIPSKGNLLTPIIVYLNIFVFLIMVITGVNAIAPSVESLINWGGNLRELTFGGQPWRLMTNVFVHGGLIHLLFNMYALLHIGGTLETEIGRRRYLIGYLATGVLASLVSVSVNDNIVSIGASGAIFGMYGLFLGLLLLKVLDIPKETRKSLISSIMLFIGYNILFGITQEGIDNAAHIGGLISGFVVGLVYYPSFKQPKYSKIIGIGISIVVIVLALVLPKVNPSKVGDFNKAMLEFSKNEEKALWMYREDLSYIPETKLQFYQDKLKKEGIDLWKQNLKLLSKLSDLPPNLQLRIDLLKKYCDLRIESCELMQALLKYNKSSDQLRIEEVNRELEQTILHLEQLVNEA